MLMLPYATFQTAEAFQDRVGRAARSHLKKELADLGIEDISQLKEQMAEAAKIREQQEEQRKAEMSEIERLREEKTLLEQRAQEQEARADEIAFDAHIAKLCISRGIKDAEYAKYRIMQRVESLGEDEELDEAAFLDELMANPQTKAALGIEEAPVPPRQVDAKPSTTTSNGAKPGTPGGPPAAPSANPADPPKSAMEMSKEEFRQRLASMGVSQ